MAEEEKKIEPTLTGMPIETLFRRHSQFLLVLAFCFFLGWYTFALFLIAWVTGARWADNEGYLEKYNMELYFSKYPSLSAHLAPVTQAIRNKAKVYHPRKKQKASTNKN